MSARKHNPTRFPAIALSKDPRTGVVRRHHVSESSVTTMIYTHVLNRGAMAVRSPLDSQPEAHGQRFQ